MRQKKCKYQGGLYCFNTQTENLYCPFIKRESECKLCEKVKKEKNDDLY